MSEEQKKILQMVENKQISAEQGVQLLGLVMDGTPADVVGQAGENPTALADDEPSGCDVEKKHYWVYPFWSGALLMVLGGTVISATRSGGRGTGWTLVCGWMPLVAGVLVLTLSAWARNAHWIQLSVKGGKDRISLSVPFPLRLVAAVLRVARQFVPQLRNTAVDEALLSLQDGLRDAQLLILEVQDHKDGEQIQIRMW